MDAQRFDALVRLVTTGRSRRDAFRLLMTALAAGVGLAAGRQVVAQTCLANGERCDPKADPNGCCSGKCSRRRKRCKAAPDQGICTIEDNTCAGTPTICDDDGSGSCRCFVTTRGFSFCAVNSVRCFNCETDRDCVRRDDGQRGDRCVECTNCGTNDRGCARKCPNPA